METNIKVDIELRIQAFVKLGSFLRSYVSFSANEPQKPAETPYEVANTAIDRASIENGWFTRENILFALEEWGNALGEDSLRAWLGDYELGNVSPQKIAIISAGNIPMVGFHDLLCTLITGHSALVKCSSNDKVLLPFLADYLMQAEPSLANAIAFTDGRFGDFDAVIATGSNNTARYFEYYFGKKPHIIRKNRNSVAVLDGNETKEQLELLGEDIFRYYGLGCRSVSKIFIPQNYNFDLLFNALYRFRTIIDQQKYINNYDYNKAVFLMSNFSILDNGFFILKEDEDYASPIACLYYEYYDNPDSLREKLKGDSEQIQCVVSSNFLQDEIGFGQTQRPGLSDYADGVDTVEFLLRI